MKRIEKFYKWLDKQQNKSVYQMTKDGCIVAQFFNEEYRKYSHGEKVFFVLIHYFGKLEIHNLKLNYRPRLTKEEIKLFLRAEKKLLIPYDQEDIKSIINYTVSDVKKALDQIREEEELADQMEY